MLDLITVFVEDAEEIICKPSLSESPSINISERLL
jgi:hypothetical protein